MISTATDSTFLHNANVLTLDQKGTVGTGVLIEGGRIKRIVFDHEFVGSGHRHIDLEGATLLPGFIDAHSHPLALGAALSAIDCSPENVSSISELGKRLNCAAQSSDGWVRARGYDELLLAEKRHPTASDLEKAAPGRMIHLRHASGHGVVLSTLAMQAVGINKYTDPPPGGTIERDPATGEPTGVLFEMDAWLRERLPRPSENDLNNYAKAASNDLLAKGITSVTDAGHDNSVQKAELYCKLSNAGLFRPRTTVMLSSTSEQRHFECGSKVRIGATKLLITFSGGDMHPSFDALADSISEQNRTKTQVAIHAVESDAVVVACAAFSAVGTRSENLELRHRIEHASECTPEVAMLIADAGLSVVTQLGFVQARGERYLRAWRDAAADPEDLYAVKNLIDAGVHVGGSSDAPFGPTAPLTAIQASVTRHDSNGSLVGAGQAISTMQALNLYGPMGAWMDHQENAIGTIDPGKQADFVVLENDPKKIIAEQIGSIPVIATIIDGVPAYGSLPGY